jgi:hypothetical protein|tara:strand:- start:86 stop:337 length:252 start_codon:yes stop_codon:yes gene_type:complete
MDIMQRAGAWIIGLTHISVMLLTLGIVWGVLFGAAVPFVGGDVVGNIIGIVNQLGNAGLAGLIALVVVIWLFRHQNRFDDALD